MLSKMREMKEISETDDFKKAFDCYKKMPLDKKINILKEKISILEEYSKCQNNTEHDNGT